MERNYVIVTLCIGLPSDSGGHLAATAPPLYGAQQQIRAVSFFSAAVEARLPWV